MRLIARQFLTCLVILFIIGGLYAKEPDPYPEAANCESDKDCLKGKAKCIRRECHCIGDYDYGDGKTKCDKWKKCRNSIFCLYFGYHNKNTNCLVHPQFKETTTCKCKSGYFARAGFPRCRKPECFSDRNCSYGKCTEEGFCRCVSGQVKEGKTCKPAPAHPCKKNEDCHEEAECHRGKCRCVGKTTGNGLYCRASLPCPKENVEKCKAGGSNVISCVVNPLFPDQPECKCHVDFKTSEAGICVELTECEKNDFVCPTGKVCKTNKRDYWCACKDGYEEIVHGAGDTTCKDIDECSQDACSAIENSVCANIEGGYKCECKEGFRKNADHSTCEVAANQVCKEGVCKCSPGFVKNSDEECIDMDECSQDETPCGANEECLNDQGTYSCVCRSGYKKKNKICVRKDECNCKRDEVCLKGNCKCKKGYKKSTKGYCVPRRHLGAPPRQAGLGLSLHGNCFLSNFLLCVLGAWPLNDNAPFCLHCLFTIFFTTILYFV